MDKDAKFKELLAAFMRIINKYHSMEDTPKKFGTEYLLYKSEINTIEVIGTHPECNMTELAERLGITKGALSQVVSKLKKKQLLTKVRKADNEKEVFLQLSDQGKKAYEGHKEFHNSNFAELYNEFKGFSDEQILFTETLFKKIENQIDHFNKNNGNCCK